MLERVAQGQTRFSTPGIAPDPRGIALGRFGVMLFPSLDGVVGWLRVYSDEAGLDDLLAGMKILRVRTQLQSRAFLVIVPSSTSYLLDRASRCARLVGGATFTGSSKHFVLYRDDRSPYGYDVVDLTPPPAGAEVVLHAAEGSQAYSREGEMDIARLVLRLSLRRLPGGERLDAEGRASLVLTVPSGLAPGVIRYLWRNRVRTEVALVTPAAADAPESRYLLARVADLPPRILESFLGIPGLGVHRPILENVVVEVGYRHPIELSSCAGLFPADKFFVFSGARDAVDVLAGPIELSDAQHLTDIDIKIEEPRERAGAVGPAQPVGIPLKLAPSVLPPRRIVGALVSWQEAPRLKKLVYALPPSTLRGHRIASSERGILLVARDNVDVVPLGSLLSELLPGLFLPLGMDLVPRVASDVLAEALGHGPGRVTVFPLDGGPFYIAEERFEPLERRALAKLDVPAVEGKDLWLEPPGGDPKIVNDPVGRFALWGFPAPKP
jgi:hypothetical protein